MTALAQRANSAETTVRSITRAVDLLQLFDGHHPYRGLREAVELTGLPKTTVVRLLATLAGQGLVSERADGSYGLGAAFLRWVRLAQDRWQVGADVRAAMRALADECGETINLYVRQDVNRICIAQEEGSATVRSVVPLGVGLPLTVGAPAAVLLAEASESTLDALLTGERGDDLRVRVSDAAEKGYAVSHGEREQGASAVAAPVRGSRGQVVAALSVSGPTSRFTPERVRHYAKAAIRTASEITQLRLESVEANL